MNPIRLRYAFEDGFDHFVLDVAGGVVSPPMSTSVLLTQTENAITTANMISSLSFIADTTISRAGFHGIDCVAQNLLRSICCR